MAARGMYDITKEITGKAESLKEWVEKGKGEASPSKATSPAIAYPAVVNTQKQPLQQHLIMLLRQNQHKQ